MVARNEEGELLYRAAEVTKQEDSLPFTLISLLRHSPDEMARSRMAAHGKLMVHALELGGGGAVSMRSRLLAFVSSAALAAPILSGTAFSQWPASKTPGRDLGHLDLAITIGDEKAYIRSWT